MIGQVVSAKLKYTATVLVKRIAMHPLYRKTFVRTKKYLADDQIGVKDGDLVEIIATKPVSKRKHWKITKVLGRSLAEIAIQQMKEKAEEVIAEVMPAEDRSSVLSDQLSDKGQSVVSKSENRKQKTDNRKTKEVK